jgi:hypothetical protein
MKSVLVHVSPTGELWLKCADHGLFAWFKQDAEFTELAEAEHNHALTHLTEILEIA